jgi:D-tyrosyl-tRNA(Tyr) deacylase
LISLIQRVSEAHVTVDGDITGRIGRGILAFVAVQPGDTDATVARMAERVITYRVFPDETGRMNRSLADEGLALLIVPQFTLAADTKKGTPVSPGRRRRRWGKTTSTASSLVADCRWRRLKPGYLAQI